MVRYLIQRGKLSSNNTRPETNVVRTIGAHLLEPWSNPPRLRAPQNHPRLDRGVPADEVPRGSLGPKGVLIIA